MLEIRGLLRFVNTLQGTDSHHGLSKGNTLPLVARPFGMNHWSAQTDEVSSWFFSPRQRKLQGIRCTHQPSPWIGDYGHFAIMANTGKDLHLSARKRSRAYKGDFHPHRFRAELLNDGTVIEMTPTERGAVFQFEFPKAGGRVVLEPIRGISGIEIVDSKTITGWVSGNSGSVPSGFKHFFIARFDREAVQASSFRGDSPVTDSEADRLGFFAEFDGNVGLQIATSFISAEQAQINLEQEMANRSFEELAGEAEAVWEEALARIKVEGGAEEQFRTFYSCLYRTQLFPRVWHEPNPEGGIHHRSPYTGQVHAGPLYTDNGFWDTYRTIYPLFALLQPDRLTEILEGWTNAYKEGGWFPQWVSPGYRACMVGTHIDAVIADGVARGITGFDVASALEGLLKHADQVGDPAGAWGRIGIEDYKRLGYVSTDHHESVARSLDYAYDDWCIGQVLQAQGRDATPFNESALTYKNLYDPEVGFMRAKNPNGSWSEPWDEFKWGNPYVEGGPWQASWAVQHDAAGLIRLFGGEQAFTAKLDKMLTTPPYFAIGDYGYEIHEMTEMAIANFGQYAHSNQPVHHVLYLYNAAGRPWRTQKEVRRVMAEMYTPDDQPGDEDNGEMSAWYVLSALGIFPLTPGHPSWTLGSPIFERARVTPTVGNPIVVESTNAGPANVFVSQVALNGQPIDRLFVTHDELASGGSLAFEMSDIAAERVVPPAGRPYSLTPYHAESNDAPSADAQSE